MLCAELLVDFHVSFGFGAGSFRSAFRVDVESSRLAFSKAIQSSICPTELLFCAPISHCIAY